MYVVTPRLLIRSGTPSDGVELTAAIAHLDVARMLERLPWPYTLDHAVGWLGIDHPADRPEPLIVESATGQIVGGVGLMEKDEVELGYWITPAAWGRGFATEAARAMVAHGKDTLGLTHIASGHFADNPASGRVLAKAGFQPSKMTGTRFNVARATEVAFVGFEWER